jgi:hypothetical protein
MYTIIYLCNNVAPATSTMVSPSLSTAFTFRLPCCPPGPNSTDYRKAFGANRIVKGPIVAYYDDTKESEGSSVLSMICGRFGDAEKDDASLVGSLGTPMPSCAPRWKTFRDLVHKETSGYHQMHIRPNFPDDVTFAKQSRPSRSNPTSQ